MSRRTWQGQSGIAYHHMSSGRLREQPAPHDDDFGARNSDLAPENTYFWNFFHCISAGYLGPTTIKSNVEKENWSEIFTLCPKRFALRFTQVVPLFKLKGWRIREIYVRISDSLCKYQVENSSRKVEFDAKHPDTSLNC